MYKKSKSGRTYKTFEATADNWKPEYTKILGFVQKKLPDDKISELVGVSITTVKKVRRSPYFQEKLDKALNAYEKRRSERLADIQVADSTMTKLEKAAQDAANIIIKALKGDTSVSKTQISVAKDILDRSGYKAVEKTEVTHKNYNYTPEEIESARATMFEMLESMAEPTSTDAYVISTAGESGVRQIDHPPVQDSENETPDDLQLELLKELPRD